MGYSVHQMRLMKREVLLSAYGSRFVVAFSTWFLRISNLFYHIVWLNLRPVLVRQGSEVMMQVVFEVSLSYLAMIQEPSFTHSESTHKGELLYRI